MPIDPTIAYSAGTLQGVAGKLGDLDRRLRGLEGRPASIGPNSVGSVALVEGSINASHIVAGSIDASVINASSIGAAVGQFVSINASQIVAGSIDTARMTANVVLAVQASISTLSAITSNMGSITAGTITGGTVQSSASGSRVVLDSAGIRGFALDGTTKTFEINTGTGIASFVGTATLNASSVVPTQTLSGTVGSGNVSPATLSGLALGGGNIVPNSSIEQGTNTDTGSTVRDEGWQYSNSTGSGYGPSTEQAYHGSYSTKLVAAATGNMWFGRRDTGANRLKIAPGRKYTISVYTRANSVARGVSLYAYWYAAQLDGSAISSTNGYNLNGAPVGGTQTNVVGDWQRISYTVTAPSNANWLGTIVHFTSAAAGEVHYVDAYQAEEGDVLTAYQPKGDEILYGSIRSLFIGAGEVKANNVVAGAINANHLTVAFGGNNLAINSSFEDSAIAENVNGAVPGWATTTSVTTQRSTTHARSGTSSMRVTSTAVTSVAEVDNLSFRAPVKAGQRYSVSAYVRSGTGTDQVRVRCMFYDAASATVAAVAGESEYGSYVTPAANWLTRVVREGITAPPTAVSMRVLFYMNSTVIGNSYYLDDVLIEPGALASEYPTFGTIGPTQITPNSLTTEQIKAGSIQAGDLSVATLESITANMGTLTSGTIVGGTIKTANSPLERIELDSAGIRFFNALNVQGLTSAFGGLTTNPSDTADRTQFDGAGLKVFQGTSERLKIHHDGVVLTATDNNQYTFPAPTSFTWKSSGTGNEIAKLYSARYTSGTPTSGTALYALADSSYVKLDLGAIDSTVATGGNANLVLEYGAQAASIFVKAQSPGFNATKLLFKGSGQSDFGNRFIRQEEAVGEVVMQGAHQLTTPAFSPRGIGSVWATVTCSVKHVGPNGNYYDAELEVYDGTTWYKVALVTLNTNGLRSVLTWSGHLGTFYSTTSRQVAARVIPTTPNALSAVYFRMSVYEWALFA